jgi:hypothetical protein
MTMNHFGDLRYPCQLAAICPAETSVEILPRPVGVVVSPIDAEVLLDGPGLGSF